MAELSPQVYTSMQEQAPEFIEISVDDVDTGWCLFFCTSRNIKITATVTAVTRTATNLEVGNTITIKYEHDLNRLNRMGPSSIPILEKDKSYPAYLIRDDNDASNYRPSAMGQSFYSF